MFDCGAEDPLFKFFSDDQALGDLVRLVYSIYSATLVIFGCSLKLIDEYFVNLYFTQGDRGERKAFLF